MQGLEQGGVPDGAVMVLARSLHIIANIIKPKARVPELSGGGATPEHLASEGIATPV